MKFLCLHGLGTSSTIFQMQTGLDSVIGSLFLTDSKLAAFRYELAENHTYEFVQGVVHWDLPLELESISDPSKQHYAYYDPSSPSSFVTALEQLKAYIHTNGPFDGVLAYSQGAGLAAMLLVQQRYLAPSAPALFKVAIFFSPIAVYDPVAYQQRGEVRVLDDIGDEPSAIDIPTVIIYGAQDPKRDECEGVKAICNKSLSWSYIHEGGHEVPGIRVKNAMLETVRLARRGITSARKRADWR